VHGALARAADAEAAYGRSRPVVVVVRPVAAGDPIGAEDVAVRHRPEAVVPEGALAERPDPATARVDLVPGEVLVAGRIAGHGRTGPAARLGPDERAVAVPLAVPGLPLASDDRVDLVSGGAYGGGPEGDLPVGAPAEVVASGARVLEVGGDAIVVAVPAAVAIEVVAALTAGPVVAALRPVG